MRVLIFGNSNSIRPDGYLKGLADAIPTISIVNRSVGAAPGTQFAFYGQDDFSQFDAVLFDSIVCDETFHRFVGSRQFLASLYYELFATIAAQTRLIVLGFCCRRFLHAPSPFYLLQRDLAQLVGAEFISVREFLLARAGELLPEGAPLYDGDPEFHPNRAVSREFGRELGFRLQAARPAGPIPQSFAKNFRGIVVPGHYPGTTYLMQSRLISQEFLLLDEGQGIELDGCPNVVGFYFDISGTTCFLKLTGPDEVRAKCLLYRLQEVKFRLRFVSIEDGMRVTRIQVMGPCDAFEDSPGASPHPVDQSPNKIGLAGVACWSGAMHTLDLPHWDCTAPVAPSIMPGYDRTFDARDMPVGRGWHDAYQRGAEAWARCTGPGQQSFLVLDMAAGDHLVELRASGGASAESLFGMAIWVGEHRLEITIASADGHWLATGHIRLEAPASGMRLSVPVMVGGVGIEVISLRLAATELDLAAPLVPSPDALAPHAVHASRA